MIEPRITYWNPSVAAMVAYLDREEIAKIRIRRLRNEMRKLKHPKLRKFALTLRSVLEDVPGPENLQGEKIQKALKIGRASYFSMRKLLDSTLSKCPICG